MLHDFGAGRNPFSITFELPMLELTFRGSQNGKTLENWTIGSEVRYILIRSFKKTKQNMTVVFNFLLFKGVISGN